MTKTNAELYPYPIESKLFKTIQPFAFGGLAGMISTCVIQPLDMIKVRIQLKGEGSKAAISRNPFTTGLSIIKEEGFLKLYSGLSAGLLRQATYTTARMGLFRTVSEKLAPGKTKRELPFTVSLIAGLTAGGLGSIIGTPSDLALVRMQADGTLPKEQRRNYKNVFDALKRIAKEEGTLSLWKGCSPTVIRAMALNVGMLSTNDQIRPIVYDAFGSGGLGNFVASVISGFCASAASLPFDFMKTRIQKQKAGPDGKLQYSGFVDCFLKTMKAEGPLAFYKGFFTFCIRITPHATITLMAVTRLNNTFGPPNMVLQSEQDAQNTSTKNKKKKSGKI